MRQFFLFLCCLLLATQTYAECATNGLWVFPKGPDIKQNSLIIIDGFADSQVIINGLNQKYEVFLQAGSKKIKLKVIATYVGGLRLTQAVLKPETALKVGETYKLVISNLPKEESLTRYNPKTEKHQPITFKVTAGNDLKAPVLSAVPKEISKSRVEFSDGPAAQVRFECPVADDSELLVKTTLKNRKTGVAQSYYLSVDKNQFSVGHNMCSGAFLLEKETEYEVEFSFMDASGNHTTWSGERIRFTAPNAG